MHLTPKFKKNKHGFVLQDYSLSLVVKDMEAEH